MTTRYLLDSDVVMWVLRRQGITLGQVDVLIAATARAHDLMLVTYNRSDFPMPDITLYAEMLAI
ncbi:type II toxin-antitoxin system VapC family toxin [Candidatus Poribacteria bacterium]|nr:type II toxin-antitoxin system VapC family toxin [Candidatus Poribacteria bacterium]